jgi:hypothetical protein
MADFVGAPEWLSTEFYHVIAKASVAKATPADRSTMMRALLEERFPFAAHVEKRDSPQEQLGLKRQPSRAPLDVLVIERMEQQLRAGAPDATRRNDDPLQRLVLIQGRSCRSRPASTRSVVPG